MGVKKKGATNKAAAADVKVSTVNEANRDAVIEAFLERESATPDEAYALVEQVGLDSFQKDFQRRNGALPQHNGYPMAALSNGTVVSLDPVHECNFEHGRSHMASGLITLFPTNGR